MENGTNISKSLENIPYKHFEYLEGYDHNATLKELKKGSWKKNLKNYQSIVDGYWIRFKILNNFNTNEIGLFHNWNTEKKVFTDFNGLEKMYSYWNFETDAWVDDGRVLDKYKILLPKNEVTIVYNYFRNNPLDRYMGKTNGLDRIGIGTWETVRFQQYLNILSNIATISIVFSFALYYLFMFIVSKGPYIWLSLSLFQLSILSTTNFRRDSDALCRKGISTKTLSAAESRLCQSGMAVSSIAACKASASASFLFSSSTGKFR